MSYNRAKLSNEPQSAEKLKGEPIGRLQGMEKEKRNAILRPIKSSEGATLHQIVRVTGLNAMNVQRA
jgi:hypothetical protein